MSYNEAKSVYEKLGIDTDECLTRLEAVPISIHCWQGDDVRGFEGDGGASDGIQTTGNYPGRARNFDELKADFLFASRLIPGKKRINLHASYAVFSDAAPRADRDALTFAHFTPWVRFARENDLGIDFNPTCFSHRMVKNSLTLSSPDAEVRAFWIRHCKACRRIAEQIGTELGSNVLNNVWIPDGLKDVPSDRYTPRLRLRDSLDEIFAENCPHVYDSVESKVFGIGLESYTVGSNEFYMAYAAARTASGKTPVYNLLDNGHYHPTETVSDKIPALLCFFEKLPLHITRGVRWDSDHVVLYDDEIKEICKELVRNDALERVLIGLDYFDASVNRVAAWVIGARNVRKALLFALLQPNAQLKALQDSGSFTEKMALSEQAKTLPFYDVWEEFCRRTSVANDTDIFALVDEYERDVLSARD